MKRPFLLYILFVLHVFIGLNASVGGLLMILKPDGSLLGMQKDWLINSPFESYFIPGFILLLMLGILPLCVFYGLLRKPEMKLLDSLNIYKNMHWAWTYSFYTGVIIISWIIVQLLMTRYFWLQPVIIAVGLLIIIFTMMPAVINYYKKLR
jgi:hypothetical protein